MAVMEKTVVDLRGRLGEINRQQAKALQEAGPTYDFSKAESLGGADAADNLAKFQALEAEATDVGEELSRRGEFASTESRIAEQSAKRPHIGHTDGDHGAETRKERLTPGQAFVQSADVKDMDPSRMGQSAGVTLDGLSFKATTFDTASATLTEYDRQPPMVLVGQMQLTVADLLAQGETSANTIRYVQEDTFTNAATTVAEGGTKPEAAWDTSEVDAPVRKIAVTSKVTDELFSDFPAMASYIDGRMRFMVAQTEESQLLTGTGTSPQIKGILNIAGIQTQAKGADNGPDAIFKGLIKVSYVGFFPPDGIVQHPTDWQNVRLLKDANGNYILGPPGMTAEPRLWGYPVVVTTAITVGTTLVGAFRLGAQIFYREGLRVESTNSNEDDFKTNKIAIRAEQREALAVYRPKAFCTVTGL